MPEFSNTNDFIVKAKAVHGETYDYSKVVYVRAIQKVEIICSKHGIFLQQPNNHLSGYGCKKCAIETMALSHVKDINYFLTKANEKHGNRYDYSFVELDGMCETPVKIVCKKHGVFLQRPSNHLSGKGCRECFMEINKVNQCFTLEEWITKARKVHGDIYDYSLVKYKNKNGKVDIICKMHGVFHQTAHNHLCSNGCPVCAKITQGLSYARTKNSDANNIPCCVYVLKVNSETETFYKIGISTNLRYRFRELHTIYRYNVVRTFKSNLSKSIALEQKVLKSLKQYKYVPKIKFGGYKECLRINPLVELLRIMR